MRKFYFLLIALLFSAFLSVSFSQSSANYTFATNATGSLATDMNGNPLDMSTGATTLLSSGTDDTRSSLTNIGFDFWFMGVQNSTFSCTENGIIQLGGNTVGASTYTISANTTLRLLAPFANDMRVGTDGVIQSKTFGSAPNRVAVIEYRNIMIRWASTAAAGTGTWQVRLYENTGIIEYVYGAMATNASTQSTVNVGFSTNTTTGTFVSVSSLHVATTSGTFVTFTPTASSTVTHLHSTADGSRRVYRFTPTAPLAPSALTFTSVGSTNMTLNWVDNAPDELGYAIYRSTDNINFTYIGLTAANVTTSSQIGLSPTTLYYWRVAAYSEGVLSSFATGSQSTTACSSLAGGTYTVGPTGNYTSLTSATAALSNGTAGPVIIELQSTYTSASETFPIILTTGACAQTGGVIIRPEAGAVGLSISSSNATATIDINGGANFIIDGRPGGSGTTKQLTISNTSFTGTAVRFINEASGNTLRHTTITGVNTGAAGAVVTFAGTTGANGNDNNLIDNCDIRDGATTPTNGIYSLGQSATITNDNITISNSNIFNFFQPGNATAGININSFNNNWTVTGNSFYQTAARTSTIGSQHNGVFISNSGIGFSITNNFIGGGAPSCGGTAWNLGGSVANRFVGISVAAGAAATTTVQGNTVANLIVSTTSGATTTNGTFSGVWVSGGNANIISNTIGATTGTGSISVTTSTGGGLANTISYSGVGNVSIQNNLIGSITLLGSSTSVGHGFNGILVSNGTPTITGNTIGSTSTANSVSSSTVATATQALMGIQVTSGVTTATAISNNTVANINQSGTATGSLIRGIQYGGTGVATISSNTVYNLSGATANTTVAGASTGVTGIVCTGSSANATVTQNTIYALSATNTGAVSTVVAGIGYSNPTEGLVTRNRIYDLRNASTGTTATAPPMAIGVLLRANNNVTVANNMISLGNAQTSNTQFVGIMNSFTGTIAAKIYFNSVNIQGTAASGALPSFGYLRGDNTTIAITTPVDIRNNIFTNSRSGGTGKHYAIANNFGATASATGWGTNASNYNLLNATAATLAYWTTDRTFATWQTASASDANSISNGTISYTDASTADLHIASIPTSIEGNGDPAAISNVTVDFDNQARVDFSPTDIGADAGNFLSSPSIAFTPLTNACGAGQRTLTATITDVDGVPTSGTGLPVLYWRINTGSYSSVTGVSIGSDQYQFTFGSGAVIGDVVSYYIVAQDNNGNVGSQPAIGASGYTANPPAVSTPTTNPNSYSVLSILNGIYTVGVGGTYPTLTAAVNAYNTLCLGGPVTFTLTDAAYLSETFPIVINANPQASSVNTLTIKPANGVSPSITSTGVAIVLNGADFVNLDGSNTAGGTTRDLTIQSTNTTTNGVPVVWIASLGAGAGATNNSVSNCIIQSGTTGTSSLLTWGIFMGASSGAAIGPDNDNNTISNNLIRKAYYGIQAIGGSTSAEVNDNLVIRGNSIGGSTTSSDAIGLNALIISQANNAQISRNDIFGINTTTSFDAVSITSGVTNSFFTSNVIRNHQNTGTNRAAAVSISSGANADITFANNMIYGVIGNGTSGNTFGCYGFRVTSGSGYKFYYNTVNLSGNRDLLGTLPTSISAAFMISGTTASGIDVRNNIFVNSQTAATPKSYAIYSDAANTAFTNINFNNYSVSGAQGVLGFLGADQATLPALRTAFGGNTASVSAVPTFVSSTDLHLTNSPGDNLCMEGKATPISGITTDIDGQTRNASTPDIGADEFVFTPPTFVVTPPAAICVGGSVNLTAGAITVGSTVGQTFGYFTDAACTNTLATPGAVTTAGTYYIKATFTSGTCTYDQILPVIVTINALPTIGISVAETSGTTANDGTICVGGSATLTASGATSYVWSTAATTAAITVSPTITTSYTVTGTDANGCQNTASTTLTVNALPTPSITVAETSGATNNDGTICFGASASLTAAGGTSYSWAPGGATTAAITVSPAATTNYVVTVTDANACVNTSNTTITVTPLPTQFSVTGGGPYCSGGVGSSVGLSGSETGVTYQLVEGGTTNVGAPVTGTGSAISFGLITTTGTYTVVATNATTTCTQNMTGSVSVSINPLPVISSVLTQPTTCISTDGAINITVTGAGGPYTYSWTGTGVVPTQEDQTGLRVGAYSVTVTAANTCQATSTIDLVGPTGCDVCPTIGALTSTPNTVCQDGTATLSATGLTSFGNTYGIRFVVSPTPLTNPYTTGTVVATIPNASLGVTTVGPPAVNNASTTYTFTTAGTNYVYAILSPTPVDPACRPFMMTPVTVVTAPDVNTVANQTLCSGGNTTSVNFSGTIPGTVYTWTNSNTSIGLAASGTGNIGSFTATNITNAPVTATVTVTPNNILFVSSNLLSNGGFETGTLGPWTLAGSNSGSSCDQGFEVYTGNVNNCSGLLNYTPQVGNFAISAAFDGAGPLGREFRQSISIPTSFTAASLQFMNQYEVDLLNYCGGCTGRILEVNLLDATGTTTLANLYSLTLAPGSVYSQAWATQTQNVLAALTPYAGQNAMLSFKLTVPQVFTGPGWIAFDDIQLNLSSSPGISSCPGPSKTFTITVNPIPTVNTVAPVSVCSGTSVSVPFSGFVTGTTYNWTNSNTAIGLAASGTGDLSFTGTNSGTTPISANIIVTPNTPGELQYRVYSTHGGIGNTSQYSQFANNAADFVAMFNTANSLTTLHSAGSAAPGLLLNWAGWNSLTSQGILIPTNGDYFGVEVTGTFIPRESGVYSFGIDGDDGVDLSINGTVVTSFYGGHGFSGYNYGDVTLVAGQSYTIRARMQEWEGGEGLAVVWKRPSQTSYSLQLDELPGCTGTPISFPITINPTPTVNAVSNQVVCNTDATTAVSFSGAVTGTVYNWTNSNPSIGLAASGTGNIASFTAVNTGTAPVTATITVTPAYTNGGVTCSGTATTFTITVNPSAQVNTVANQTVCNGANTTAITFGTTNTGGTTTYSWTNSTPSIGLAASGTGNIAAFAGINTGTAPVTATITVTPSYTSGGVTCTGATTSFTITVNPTPTVSTVTNQVVCNGANTTAVAFSGAVAGTVYNWTNNTPSIGLAASGTGNIAAFAGINTGTTPVIATITVTPSYTNNGVTCTGTSTSFTITVNPTPTVNVVSNQTVCTGGATTDVTFSGSVTGTVYNWTNNTTSIGLGASGTGNIPSFNGVNTGTTPVTATITVTPSFTNDGITCTGTPRTFTITVNPTPTVSAVSDQVVCNGANTTAVAFSGAVTGTVYNWTNNTPAIGLAATGTGNIASFAAVNTGITPITATITVTPSYTNNGVTCTGTPTSFTITVNPTPTVNTVANQVLCNGSATTAVTFSGAVAGTVYSWTNNTPSIGLAATGTTTVPSFTAVNAGVTPIVATITVTPSFTSGGITCTGTPRTFTITVNPTPTVTQPANQVVCNRATTTAVAFTGAVAGTVYSWTNSDPSIGLAASGTGNIAAFAAVNTTQTPVVATITVTPSFTNGGVTCTGTPRTFTITVNPTPIVVATDIFNQRICISDGAVALNATPVGGSWSGTGVSGFNFIPGATAVGNYILTYSYTNQFGCTSTDTTTAKVSACDERNISLAQGGTVVFPNPNSGQFNIRVNSTRFQFLQMRLYNAQGQLVATKQWSGLVYGQVMSVDMRHLAAGLYTVRIIYDGGNLYEDKSYQMLIAR